MIRKGTLKGFDSGTYKATVQIDGSVGWFLTGVPVSRGIPSGEMVAGRTVAVVFFDPGNPEGGMVSGVF